MDMGNNTRRALEDVFVEGGFDSEISGTYRNILYGLKRRHFREPVLCNARTGEKLWDVVDPRYWYMFDPKIWFEICSQPTYQGSMYSVQQPLIRKAAPTIRQRIEENLKGKGIPRTVKYIDMGVGNGDIANLHLREIADYVDEYVAVDIIDDYLREAVSNVKGAFPKRALRSSFEELSLPPLDGSIYLFEIGPTYGNFGHDEIDGILLRNMGADGLALVSAQIIRDEHDRRLVMQAYKEGQLNERMLKSLLYWLGFADDDFEFKYYFRESFISISARVNSVPPSLQDTDVGPGDYLELFKSWKPAKPEFESVLSRNFDTDTFYTRRGEYRFAVLRRKQAR
jgi:Histidine-specific methyltransferase, SAM-dependent